MKCIGWKPTERDMCIGVLSSSELDASLVKDGMNSLKELMGDDMYPFTLESVDGCNVFKLWSIEDVQLSCVYESDSSCCIASDEITKLAVCTLNTWLKLPETTADGWGLINVTLQMFNDANIGYEIGLSEGLITIVLTRLISDIRKFIGCLNGELDDSVRILYGYGVYRNGNIGVSLSEPDLHGATYVDCFVNALEKEAVTHDRYVAHAVAIGRSGAFEFAHAVLMRPWISVKCDGKPYRNKEIRFNDKFTDLIHAHKKSKVEHSSDRVMPFQLATVSGLDKGEVDALVAESMSMDVVEVSLMKIMEGVL